MHEKTIGDALYAARQLRSQAKSEDLDEQMMQLAVGLMISTQLHRIAIHLEGIHKELHEEKEET